MSEWINVKDRWPAVGEFILFCRVSENDPLSTSTGMLLLPENEKACIHDFARNRRFDIQRITHWQTLPEAPLCNLTLQLMDASKRINSAIIAFEKILQQITKD